MFLVLVNDNPKHLYDVLVMYVYAIISPGLILNHLS